jgi:hypothetical protein
VKGKRSPTIDTIIGLSGEHADVRSAFDRSPAGCRDPDAHGFYCPAVLFHRFGVHLHEASGDKLEDFVGEPRNDPSIGAAMWRVRE